MGKKKFIDGLESIFGESNSPTEAITFLNEQQQPGQVEEAKVIVLKKNTGKKFTSDLDLLFQGVAAGSGVDDYKSTAKEDKSRFIKKTSRRPLGGLDALFRQTTEMEPINYVDEVTGKKRVTLVFDVDKLEKLKLIAKREQTYIKDIIGEIVEEFIEDYEKGK